MISYMCKYAPIEILEAFGTPVAIMDPHVTKFYAGGYADASEYVLFCQGGAGGF